MRRSVWALAICLSASLSAFDPTVHRNISEQALRGAGLGFLPSAIFEIQNANECVDVGVYYNLKTGVYPLGRQGDFDRPCMPHGPVCLDCQKAAKDHFDDESFQEASLRLRQLRDAVITNATHGHYIEARKLLGYALHTLQDFYSHSNWIELGNDQPFRELLSLDSYRPLTPTANQPRLALYTVSVCRDKSYLLDTAKSPGGVLLTTGYFFKGDAFDPLNSNEGVPDGKCRHGFSKLRGIAKDSNTCVYDDKGSVGPCPGHETAVKMASAHSVLFIQDCVRQISATPGALEGFFGIFKVMSNQVNRVMEVKAGEVYRVEVDPNKTGRKILWGKNLLTGQEMICGPEGTPGVDPRNYPGWVTPPLPKYNVGALIGFVYDPACPMGGKARTGAACQPMSGIYIGPGGRLRLSATGTMYLLVNDGVLGNNAGWFDVSFTLLQEPEQ